MASSKQSKPNFKVKHPYGYLVRSILLGVILVCTAVLGNFTLGLFNKNNLDGSVSASSGLNWSEYASDALSGSGTQSDPYLIASAGDLAWLANYVSAGYGESTAYKYYVLTNDIDLSNAFWPGIGKSYQLGESATTTNWRAYAFCGYFSGAGLY